MHGCTNAAGTGLSAAPIGLFDDARLVHTFSIQAMLEILARHGFEETDLREIDVGDVGVEFIAGGCRLGGGATLMGIWSVTRWASYMVE